MIRLVATLVAALALGAPAAAQDPLVGGWSLDSEASNIRFQSVKKGISLRKQSL